MMRHFAVVVLMASWILWMGQPRRDGTFAWTVMNKFSEQAQQVLTPQEFCESIKDALQDSPNLKRARLACLPAGIQP